jgi:hypothetical protein
METLRPPFYPGHAEPGGRFRFLLLGSSEFLSDLSPYRPAGIVAAGDATKIVNKINNLNLRADMSGNLIGFSRIV